MINFDALHNAKKTEFYIVKEAPNIKLWKVVPYDESPYYAIIKEKLRRAIRTFNKLKKE